MSKWKSVMQKTHETPDFSMTKSAIRDLAYALSFLYEAIVTVDDTEPTQGATVMLSDGRVGQYQFCEDSPYYGDESALCYVTFADSSDYVSPFAVFAVIN